MSDKKTPLDTALEAMESLQNTIASDVADWAADKRMAWIYAILMGWDDEAMDEVAKKHKWKSEDVARLRRYHQALAALRSMEGSEPVAWMSPQAMSFLSHRNRVNLDAYNSHASQRGRPPLTEEMFPIPLVPKYGAHPSAPAVVEPWISVEDRLPDLPIIATDGSRFSETVLVFRSKAPKHTCVGESQYGDYGSGDAGWLGESGQGVTHWMPLPSPPSPSTT